MEHGAGGEGSGAQLGHEPLRCLLRPTETAGDAGWSSGEKWELEMGIWWAQGRPMLPDQKPAKESEQEWPVRGGKGRGGGKSPNTRRNVFRKRKE